MTGDCAHSAPGHQFHDRDHSFGDFIRRLPQETGYWGDGK